MPGISFKLSVYFSSHSNEPYPIENKLQELVNSFSKNTFIYDLLFAYGQPKATIKRLQEGGLNLSKVKGEIVWKKKLFFKEIENQDVNGIIEDLNSCQHAIWEQKPDMSIVFRGIDAIKI